MKYFLLLGRLLFSAIFLFSSPGHFNPQTISYSAAAGVPAAEILVPLSGIIELLGGLSILLGLKARWGAWLIVLFLLPVTVMMHAFWKQPDAMKQQLEMAQFMKNIGLTGAALMITWFGAGPLSIDQAMAKKKSLR